MKLKMIIVGLMLFAGLTSMAQVQAPRTYNTAISALDTLTNADTTSSVTLTVTGKKSTVAFHADVTKITGTVAGTFTVYGGDASGNWAILNTQTVTNTAGTVVYFYQVDYAAWTKYKVEVITSGTCTASVRRWPIIKD